MAIIRAKLGLHCIEDVVGFLDAPFLCIVDENVIFQDVCANVIRLENRRRLMEGRGRERDYYYGGDQANNWTGEEENGQKKDRHPRTRKAYFTMTSLFFFPHRYINTHRYAMCEHKKYLPSNTDTDFYIYIYIYRHTHTHTHTSVVSNACLKAEMGSGFVDEMATMPLQNKKERKECMSRETGNCTSVNEYRGWRGIQAIGWLKNSWSDARMS